MSLARLAAGGAPALIAAVALAQPGLDREPPRRISTDDLVGIRSVSSPRFSPDGKRVAFVIRSADLKRDVFDSNVYIVSADGGEPLQFTTSQAEDTDPQWSPDGRWLAFVSRRDGVPQVYVIPTSGGEATAVTRFEGGASSPRFALDGDRIVVAVPDSPSAASPALPSGVSVRRDRTLQHLWIASASGSEPVRLTEGDFDDSDPRWSPDGQEIVFVSNRSQDPETNANTDLWVIPVKGGKPRQLTSNPGPDSQPRWSPDGSRIAYASHSRDFSPAEHTDLFVIPRSGGEPKNLTGEFDFAVSSPIWSLDGSRIHFLAMIRGDEHLFSVPTQGGDTVRVTGGVRELVEADLSPDGRTFVVVSSSPDSPAELFLAAAEGRDVRPLTSLNAGFAWLARGVADTYAYKSVDGLEIEAYITLPPEAAAEKPDAPNPRKFPGVLSLHGGPHARATSGFDAMRQLLSSNGFVVFEPNYRGSTGYGQKFADANRGDWGGMDFHDVMRGVEALCRFPSVDENRIGVFGGSYGGYLVSWAVTHSYQFRAAVSVAGVSDLVSFYGQTDRTRRLLLEWDFQGPPWARTALYVERSPVTHLADAGTPILLLHGEADRTVPISQSQEFAAGLRRLSVPVEFIRIEGLGHSVTAPSQLRTTLAATLSYFSRFLREDPPNAAKSPGSR